MQDVSALFKNKSDFTNILTGIFPGQRKLAKLLRVVNYLLEKYSRKLKQVFYLKPVFKDWTNGDLLHFTAGGYMVFAKYIREISLLSKTLIPRPIKFELPPWGPDEVGIGEPISFCTTDGDPTAAARGPWYDKIVKPEERGVLKFNAHTYGVYRRPLATADVPSCVSEDVWLPGSIVIGLSRMLIKMAKGGNARRVKARRRGKKPIINSHVRGNQYTRVATPDFHNENVFGPLISICQPPLVNFSEK